MSLETEITTLQARVTALLMLVEALYAQDLAKDDNAAIIADEVVKSALKAEAAAREKVGESEYALQITETVTSLVDRALRRAQLLRGRESPP